MKLRMATIVASFALAGCTAMTASPPESPYGVGFELVAIGDIEAVTAGRWRAENPDAIICCTMTWRYVELAQVVDQYIRTHLNHEHDSSMYIFSFAILEGEAEVSLTPLSAGDITSDLAVDGYWVRVDLEDLSVISWEYQR